MKKNLELKEYKNYSSPKMDYISSDIIKCKGNYIPLFKRAVEIENAKKMKILMKQKSRNSAFISNYSNCSKKTTKEINDFFCAQMDWKDKIEKKNDSLKKKLNEKNKENISNIENYKFKINPKSQLIITEKRKNNTISVSDNSANNSIFTNNSINRLYQDYENRQKKLYKLKQELTPSFQPSINKYPLEYNLEPIKKKKSNIMTINRKINETNMRKYDEKTYNNKNKSNNLGIVLKSNTLINDKSIKSRNKKGISESQASSRIINRKEIVLKSTAVDSKYSKSIQKQLSTINNINLEKINEKTISKEEYSYSNKSKTIKTFQSRTSSKKTLNKYNDKNSYKNKKMKKSTYFTSKRNNLSKKYKDNNKSKSKSKTIDQKKARSIIEEEKTSKNNTITHNLSPDDNSNNKNDNNNYSNKNLYNINNNNNKNNIINLNDIKEEQKIQVNKYDNIIKKEKEKKSSKSTQKLRKISVIINSPRKMTKKFTKKSLIDRLLLFKNDNDGMTKINEKDFPPVQKAFKSKRPSRFLNHEKSSHSSHNIDSVLDLQNVTNEIILIENENEIMNENDLREFFGNDINFSKNNTASANNKKDPNFKPENDKNLNNKTNLKNNNKSKDRKKNEESEKKKEKEKEEKEKEKEKIEKKCLEKYKFDCTDEMYSDENEELEEVEDISNKKKNYSWIKKLKEISKKEGIKTERSKYDLNRMKKGDGASTTRIMTKRKDNYLEKDIMKDCKNNCDENNENKDKDKLYMLNIRKCSSTGQLKPYTVTAKDHIFYKFFLKKKQI